MKPSRTVAYGAWLFSCSSSHREKGHACMRLFSTVSSFLMIASAVHYIAGVVPLCATQRATFYLHSDKQCARRAPLSALRMPRPASCSPMCRQAASPHGEAGACSPRVCAVNGRMGPSMSTSSYSPSFSPLPSLSSSSSSSRTRRCRPRPRRRRRHHRCRRRCHRRRRRRRHRRRRRRRRRPHRQS